MDDLFSLPTPLPKTGNHDLIVDYDPFSEIAEVLLRVAPHIEEFVAKAWHDGEPPKPRPLLRLDFKDRRAHIFPQVAYRHQDLYEPKYDQVREIVFDLSFAAQPPEEGDDAQRIINDTMPLGFMMQAEYGLGFVMLMRPVLYSIEEIEGLTRIVISARETTRVEGDTYYFSAADYRTLADGMHRISRRYQDESRKDRDMFAFNAVLSRVLPEKYPERSRPYQAGTIFKLLGGSNVETTKLIGRDRRSMLSVVANNAKAIAKRDPKEFVQLQKDIEIVSLDEMIEAFSKLLRRKTVEADWQELLELNPFILSMLFGQPIVILQPSASVGGTTLAGSGNKIADFLSHNAITYNAALVELKRPSTALMQGEYRKDVFMPSPDLMGAVVQILDQRLKFVTSLPLLKHLSNVSGLQAHSVDCVILAGRTPPAEKIGSFELIRSQLKDVRIITFDELLERLHMLRELLAGDRYISPVDEVDIEDDDIEEEFQEFESTSWERRVQDGGPADEPYDAPF